MSILWIEGFEAGLYSPNTGDHFNYQNGTPQIGTTYARVNGKGGYLGDTATGGTNTLLGWTVTLSDDTLAYSFGIHPIEIGHGDWIIHHAFGSNDHINWRDTNEIGVTTNAGTQVSSSGTFTKTGYHWVECEVYYHASAGTVKAWIDGTQVIDASSQATGTRPSSVSPIIGGSQTTHIAKGYYDDIIVSDGAGSYNATRPLGDSVIQSLLPSDNGNSSVLVGSDADSTDNYLHVDEEEPDDNTSYVEGTSEGDKDTYLLPDLAGTGGSILAIEVQQHATKTDSGTKYGRSVVRTGGTDYGLTSVALPEDPTYSNFRDIVEENPDTTAAWTSPEINSLEVGFEVRDS